MEVTVRIDLMYSREEMRVLAQWLSGYVGKRTREMHVRSDQSEELEKLEAIWKVLTELSQ